MPRWITGFASSLRAWSRTTVQLIVSMLYHFRCTSCLDVAYLDVNSPVLRQPNTADAIVVYVKYPAPSVVNVGLKNRTGCRRDVCNAIITHNLFAANFQVPCSLARIPQSSLPATAFSTTTSPAPTEVGFLRYFVVVLVSVDRHTQLEYRCTRTIEATKTKKILTPVFTQLQPNVLFRFRGSLEGEPTHNVTVFLLCKWMSEYCQHR